MQDYSERDKVVEVLNRLFYYTDERDWNKLQSEVFTDSVFFDIISLGAEKAETLKASKICEMWKEGFEGIDYIHHQPGNYIVTLSGDEADAIGYAIATHYKKEASNGNIRTFVGSYDFHLTNTEKGWRLDKFKYIVKYIDGNAELK